MRVAMLGGALALATLAIPSDAAAQVGQCWVCETEWYEGNQCYAQACHGTFEGENNCSTAGEDPCVVSACDGYGGACLQNPTLNGSADLPRFAGMATPLVRAVLGVDAGESSIRRACDGAIVRRTIARSEGVRIQEETRVFVLR